MVPFRMASLAFSVSMRALSSTRIALTFFCVDARGVSLSAYARSRRVTRRERAPAAPLGRGAADGRGADQRNELISIVSSRPGPTPIAEIGAPDISSSAFTYAWAFFGRSAKDLALLMSSLQPGSIS